MWIFLIPLDILRASPVLSHSTLKVEYKLDVAYFINCDMSLGSTEWAILWLLYTSKYYIKVFYYRCVSHSKLKRICNTSDITFVFMCKQLHASANERAISIRKKIKSKI
jgi:hypothetical protein